MIISVFEGGRTVCSPRIIGIIEWNARESAGMGFVWGIVIRVQRGPGFLFIGAGEQVYIV